MKADSKDSGRWLPWRCECHQWYQLIAESKSGEAFQSRIKLITNAAKKRD